MAAAAAARKALEAKCALLNQAELQMHSDPARTHCSSSAANLHRQALQNHAREECVKRNHPDRMSSNGTDATQMPPMSSIDSFVPTHFSRNGAKPAGAISNQSRKAEELIRRIGKLRQSIQAHGISNQLASNPPPPEQNATVAPVPLKDSKCSDAVDPQDIVRHFKFMRNLLKGYEAKTAGASEPSVFPAPGSIQPQQVQQPTAANTVNTSNSPVLTKSQVHPAQASTPPHMTHSKQYPPEGGIPGGSHIGHRAAAGSPHGTSPKKSIDQDAVTSKRNIQRATQRPHSAAGAIRSSTPKMSPVSKISSSQARAHAGASPSGVKPNAQPKTARAARTAKPAAAAAPAAAPPAATPGVNCVDVASVTPPSPCDITPKVKRVSTATAVKKLELDRLKRRLAMSVDGKASLDYYQQVKVIGTGSYGKVWMARHKLTERVVAIKNLDKSKLTDTDAKRRVAQEIRILGKLKHPHIIRLFEVIEEGGEINMIMEYASHGSLYELLKAKKVLGEDEVRRYGAELLTAVEYIHAKNFYHRDIKLANILLSANGSIKLADFGLGVFKSEGKKLIKFCGSPAYLAPEIILGKGYDGAAVDMWCVGIVLYALLYGDVPFKGDSFAALRRKILKGGLNFDKGSVSDGAKELLANLLNADPLHRYTATAAMKQEWVSTDDKCAVIVGQKHPENKTIDTIDSDCVSKLVKCGFTEDFIVQTVTKNEHNHALTCYYLMMERKENEFIQTNE